MNRFDCYVDAPKDLNVLQVVAMNFVATLTFFVVGLVLGVSWLTALFGAWILGALTTICGAAAISFLRQGLPDKSIAVADGPALVPGNVSDPMQLWEADRLMEIDHAATTLGSSEGDGARWDTAHMPWSLWADVQSSSAESESTAHDTRPVKSRRAG